MKTLVILSGLSCTLKDSVANYLQDEHDYIKFPDVNRNYIKTLEAIVDAPEMVNVTSKIPNIMLCANRLTVYNTFLDGFLAGNDNQCQNFVMQRTVLEHLFFENENMISTVNKDKLIKYENEFLSRFDKVILVILENNNSEMLTKFYLTDSIRTSITKSEDKLKAYEQMKNPYARYIEQLLPASLKFQIPSDLVPTNINLTNLTKEIGYRIYLESK